MRLAIDFDGTISDTNQAKADWILDKLGLIVAPWRCDRTNCVPIIGSVAYEEMSQFVYERERSLLTPEVPGASESLRRLSEKAEIHVVTARPPRRMEFAREWFIQKGIVALIHEFHSSSHSSKEEVCRRLGASALVDDDLRHLEDVAIPELCRIHFQHGIQAPSPRAGAVLVCRSWSDVVATLEAECLTNGGDSANRTA